MTSSPLASARVRAAEPLGCHECAAPARATAKGRPPSWPAALARGAGAIACVALALHLQLTTLIGVFAVGLWFLLAVILPWIWRQPRKRRSWWLGGLVALGLAGVALVLSEPGMEYVERYRWAPLHALERRDEVWLYHIHMIERYPSLWPIFPFTALLAAAAAPRPAVFCTVVFSAVFLLLSFGGMKHLNYLFFALPFLFVVWALALAQVLHFLYRCVTRATDRALRQIAPSFAGRRSRMALIGAGLAFLIIANGAPARTVLKPLGVALTMDETWIDWAPVRSALEPWLDEAAIVVTPNDMHALYYLGDYDLAVNASRLSETGDDEFSVDPRTGRPVIATTASLRLVLDCYPSGLLVVDETMYRVDWALDDEKADLVESRTTAVPAPAGVRAFRWERPTGTAVPTACRELPDTLPAAAESSGALPPRAG